jgi:hypothetical protein
MLSQQSGSTTPKSAALGLEATQFALATFGLDIPDDLTFPQEQEHDNSSSCSFFGEGSQKFLNSESTTVVATPEFTFCTATATDEIPVDPFLQSLI